MPIETSLVIDPFFTSIVVFFATLIAFAAMVYAIFVGDRFFVIKLNDCLPNTLSRIGWRCLHAGRWSLAAGLGLMSCESALRILFMTKFGKATWVYSNAAMQFLLNGGDPTSFVLLANMSRFCIVASGLAYALHIVLNHRPRKESAPFM